MAKWNLDPEHTVALFEVRHMMVTWVNGRFTRVSGTLSFDPADMAQASVEAEIDAASLFTGVERRDNHLRSADFLDAENHPELVFRSTKVEHAGETFALHGDLTIRGVTKPVTLRGELAGPVLAPWGAGRHAGFELDGEIDREDWGLGWNVALEAGGVLVSKKVKLHLAVEVMEDAPVTA